MKYGKLIKSALCLGLIAVLAVSAIGCSTAASNSASDTITIVWYPNESASTYEAARTEFANIITQATGKKVVQQLTTDYNIAIEALANGTAQICFMGAQGYVQAQQKSKDVKPLLVNSGASGTLDDAIYYSWMSVNKGEESQYLDNGNYSIANIQGKRFSFVSNSSTSGFKIPTTGMINYFSKTDKWKDLTTDDLVEGGSDKFFSEVVFGGSHQGSAVNLLTGKADLAAFCDTEMAAYMNLVSGEENKAGSVYEVKVGADAPFDTLAGKQINLIMSTPVLNGPFGYNAKTLSAEDVKKIQDLFTTAAVADNQKIFVPKGYEFVGMFKKTSKECFLVPEDSWYDPIREIQNN